MALANKLGGLLKKATSSNPTLYQAIRCMSSSKLFVGGISYTTDDQSLRDAFANYGQVIEARIIQDRDTGRSRGFGFVTYTSSEEAAATITALDGQDLHRRNIRVNYATERTSGFCSGGYQGRTHRVCRVSHGIPWGPAIGVAPPSSTSVSPLRAPSAQAGRRAPPIVAQRPNDMLRRAAWLRLHPSWPVTTAVALLRRRLKVRPNLRPVLPLRYLDAIGSRGYARMARRIAPSRPDGYSTSDGEADAYGDKEDLELGAPGTDGEAGTADGKEWEGYMLEFDSSTEEDYEEEAATEKEEK